MAEITFPASPRPRSMQWRLNQPTQINVSQWTGRRQALSSGRGWWECEYALPPIVGTVNFNPWRAFVALARGGANEFRVPVDPTAQAVSGGVVSIAGAGQTGRSLITDGWAISATILKAGQFVTIGNQLLQLTADVVSNGSGVATITFEPPIRVSPADNAVVEYKNPYALMYIIESPAYSVDLSDVYELALSFREII